MVKENICQVFMLGMLKANTEINIYVDIQYSFPNLYRRKAINSC